MPSTGYIGGFVPGDDLDVTRTVTLIPTGQTLTQAWFYVKVSARDLDAAAIFSKSITSAAVTGVGQITDTGASGTGVVLVQLTAANTLLLTALTPYAYGFKVKLANGKEYTLETGTLVAGQSVVQAS